MNNFIKFLKVILTGNTATNMFDPNFQKLLKDKKFSDELYKNIHSNKKEFTIESNGIKHKYEKIEIK